MPIRRETQSRKETPVPDFVSGRFLTDLFRMLEANGIPATQLVGDLPIDLTPNGEAHGDVEWSAFAEFMKRLENQVGGPPALEACAAELGEMKPAAVLRGLAGFSASPQLLFSAAVRWALKRALPGIEAWISPGHDNQLHIHARIHESLKPCPQVFHFAAGVSRALPRILGLADAVVEADVYPREAHYRINLPPSPNIFARTRRFFRTLFSAGSVLHFFESQQLELHARHDALRKAHADLSESEQRYRALTDAAVDVLCELDRDGRVAYVSASTEDLVGYTPEQITGSHYRLWIPKRFHARAAERFEALAARPPGGALSRELVTLHADSGRKIVAELSVRSYINSEDEWRLAGILRDVTDVVVQRGAGRNRAARASLRAASPASTAPPPADRSGHAPEAIDAAGDTRESLEALEIRSGDDSTRLEDLRIALTAHADSGETPHLTRSLATLLAALEARADDAPAGLDAALVRTAESMTRIAHDAARLDSQGRRLGEPIELQKLIDRVRLDFAGRAQGGLPRLRCEVERPAQLIHGHSGPLVVALSNLLELVAKRALGADALMLSARTATPCGSSAIGSEADGRETGDEAGAGIEFRIEALGAARASSNGDADELDDEIWSLSEAIAQDVADAHGGEVAVGSHADGSPICWLRIPTAD